MHLQQRWILNIQLFFGECLCLGSIYLRFFLYFSVPPTLEISQQPTMVWNVINVTCQIQKFYPRRFQVTWLENGNISRREVPFTHIVNKDGTYNWISWLLVNISALEENMVVTCQVEHDGQAEVIETHTVVVTEHQRVKGTATKSGEVFTPPLCLNVNWASFFMYKVTFLIIVALS